MSLARAIGDFVARTGPAEMPPEVVEKGKVCLLNGYGIGLGCHDTPYAPVARRAALAMGGEQADGATLLGDGRKTTVAAAILANAALFHGRAQEDTSGAAHLGTILLPLATALVETGRAPIQRLLPAVVLGYEVGGLFERAYAGHTTPVGLRASPLYGTLAAAATAAKLFGLDGERTAAAIANAASFAGGILQSFADGTDEWRYQVGAAACQGLTAAELARAGSVSAPHALEGRSGFVRTFARTECDVEALAATLGREWLIHRVVFKPYPVCAFNQTPVTGALVLRERIAGRAIRAVRVSMNPYETGYAGMDAVGPFHSISGTLMSIPFCIANTLIHGVPTMKLMTTYDDRAVAALIDRVKLISDPAVPTLCARIEVDLENGETLVREQNMTVKDYNYDRAAVSDLIRRVGAEGGVPAGVYNRLEAWVNALPAGDLRGLLACFGKLPGANKSNAVTVPA